IGVQLALPGRKVVATIGDGSVMYAPQALWTAARYRLPITYIVPNNTSYAILKSGMLSLDLPSAKRGIFPGMDLIDPEIDYVGLAKALGVRAGRGRRGRGDDGARRDERPHPPRGVVRGVDAGRARHVGRRLRPRRP